MDFPFGFFLPFAVVIIYLLFMIARRLDEIRDLNKGIRNLLLGALYEGEGMLERPRAQDTNSYLKEILKRLTRDDPPLAPPPPW